MNNRRLNITHNDVFREVFRHCLKFYLIQLGDFIYDRVIAWQDGLVWLGLELLPLTYSDKLAEGRLIEMELLDKATGPLVEFFREIPKTASGKILRRDLIQREREQAQR